MTSPPPNGRLTGDNPLPDDPTFLPSWQPGPVRSAIAAFVEATTDPASPGYVVPAARLAVFDHDGTLWCEKPLMVHFYALRDRYRELARANPRRLTRRLWHALRTNDDTFFDSQGRWNAALEPLADMLGVAFSDIDEAAFEVWMRAWLARWRHPRFDVPAAGLVYQPMVELIRLLQANLFTVAIVTADESAFVRLVSQPFYGVPPDMVFGSAFGLRAAGKSNLVAARRDYHPDSFDNATGKQFSIDTRLDHQPILAAGNADGDLAMLMRVAEVRGATLPLLIRHTDSLREYAYDRLAHNVLLAADAGGWPVVDMAVDWRVVFSQPDSLLTS